jgi:hypothetical protein
MKINQPIVKTTYPPGNSRSLRSLGPGTVLNHMRRAALPAVTLVVAIVLATGCSSTGAGLNARLISPIPTDPRAPNSEDDSLYQPQLSPGFDSDLFGG